MSDEPLLGEICLAIVDCEHKTVPVNESGNAWAIGTPAMVDGRIDYSKAKRIDDDVYSKWTRRMVPTEGDLILAREAPVGPVVRVPQSPRVALGQRTVLIRPNPKIVNSRYLHFLLLSAEVQNRMHAKSEGSTVRHLNVEDVRNLPIPALPSLLEQERIAEVLGALDDKIESNRRQCKILDELALTTCKKLFRSDLESDMGPRLGDVASITLGGTPSRSRPEFWDDGRIAWINSGALHERPLITASDMITDEGLRRSATKIVPSGSTVVAITGATLGVVSRLGIDAAINQSVVGIYVPDSRELTDYIYIWMRLNIARLVSSATGAAQQHVNKSNFEELQVSAPDETGLQSMIEVSSLLDAQTALSRQNKSLVALRDSLLPELLSGRLRVRDAEKVVEGVV